MPANSPLNLFDIFIIQLPRRKATDMSDELLRQCQHCEDISYLYSFAPISRVNSSAHFYDASTPVGKGDDDDEEVEDDW